MGNANIPLPELIETVKTRLRELQYRPGTIYGFSLYWRKLCEYADERQTKHFTVALGEDFLREVCHIDVTTEVQAPDLPRWKVNPPKRAIYLLVDFQNSGSVLRKKKEKYTPVSDCFIEITEHFYAMCRSRYNGERTIQTKKFTVERFLLHLEQKGIQESKYCWCKKGIRTTVPWSLNFAACKWKKAPTAMNILPLKALKY